MSVLVIGITVFVAGLTVTVTVAVSVPPLPSEAVYVKLSVP